MYTVYYCGISLHNHSVLYNQGFSKISLAVHVPAQVTFTELYYVFFNAYIFLFAYSFLTSLLITSISFFTLFN